MSVVISMSIMILLSISLPSLYQITWGTGRPVMLQASLTFSPALRVRTWSGDHSISGATENAKRMNEDGISTFKVSLSLSLCMLYICIYVYVYHICLCIYVCVFDLNSSLKILTALILCHNVSRRVRWWTDCAHSIPSNYSEFKSVSSRQASHRELGLAYISEVAPQPFASTLAPLHTVCHNFAATVPLGDVPLQGH